MVNNDSEFIFFEHESHTLNEDDEKSFCSEIKNKSLILNNNKNKIKKTFKINFSNEKCKCYLIDKSNKDNIIVTNIDFKNLINELNKDFNSLPKNQKNKDDIFFFNFFVGSYLILFIINIFGLIIYK